MALLELFEQADHAVARRGSTVWRHEPGDGWREQAGAKRLLLALPLEPEAFARHFPEAARTPLPSGKPRSRLFRFLSAH